MKIAVLLKQFKNNKKGTRGFITEDGEMFVFHGFQISVEMAEDNPQTFRIEDSNQPYS